LPAGLYRIAPKAGDDDLAREKTMKKAVKAATLATSKERFSIAATGGNGVSGTGLQTINEDPDENTLTDP